MSQKRSTSYRGAKPATKLTYREMTNLGEIANAFAGIQNRSVASQCNCGTAPRM